MVITETNEKIHMWIFFPLDQALEHEIKDESEQPFL